MNLIDVCIDQNIKRVVTLSTDKASSPINLYGASKLASDKLFVASNSSYVGDHKTSFSVVRYGNVMGSRGSVIPYFLSLKDKKELPITDNRMTRFMITLDQGTELVWHALEDMLGGEIYVKKIPSMKITDIASVIAPKAKQKIIGIRPGEKLHEQMISKDDSHFTYEFTNYYKILPQINEWGKDKLRIKDGKKVSEDFIYSSDNNLEWMTKSQLRIWININRNNINKI
jgi:FlaA1/EpsC-like NDP-sugar epimerase